MPYVRAYYQQAFLLTKSRSTMPLDALYFPVGIQSIIQALKADIAHSGSC